jgi:hypothetical protein
VAALPGGRRVGAGRAPRLLAVPDQVPETMAAEAPSRSCARRRPVLGGEAVEALAGERCGDARGGGRGLLHPKRSALAASAA